MIRYIRGRLNSLDEMCTDESARRRTNTILFTGLVALFFFVLLVAGLFMRDTTAILLALLFFPTSTTFFVVQLRSDRYIPMVSYLFGGMALVMTGAFLATGQMGGYAFLWLIIVPIVGVMVVPMLEGIIFNVSFLLLVVIMLATPLHEALAWNYEPAFRIGFPVCILLVDLCVYVTEVIRSKTQLRLAQTAEQLKSFAFTDPLTGAFNRHALNSHFSDIAGDAYGLSFAVLDLDLFKTVNDRFGHLTGDQVLCHVVDLVRDATPPNALLYRWGGEEFLVVLKTADADEAQTAFEALRACVQNTPMQSGEVFVKITVSIGGVCARQGQTIQECILQADKLLYEAKVSGRNRLVMDHMPRQENPAPREASN